MVIGYARVSTQEQKSDMQKDALIKAGCKVLFIEKMSGTISDRPELRKALDSLKQDDSLIVYRIDRLGRKLLDILSISTEIEEKGAYLKSLSEDIDLKTASGIFMFQMKAASCEFERNLIVERTNAGLTAARERGRIGGKKARIFTPEEKADMKRLYTEGVKIEVICRKFKISKPTFYKNLNQTE